MTTERLKRYAVAVLYCHRTRCAERLTVSEPQSIGAWAALWRRSTDQWGHVHLNVRGPCAHCSTGELHFFAWANTDERGNFATGPYEWFEYRCGACGTVAYDPFTRKHWPGQRQWPGQFGARRTYCPVCSGWADKRRRWWQRGATPPGDFFNRQLRKSNQSVEEPRHSRFLQASERERAARQPAEQGNALWVYRAARAAMAPSLRFSILRRDGFRCRICGRDASHGVAFEVDHIVPWSKGGADSEENLWTLCDECNAGKSARPLEEPGGEGESRLEGDQPSPSLSELV